MANHTNKDKGNIHLEVAEAIVSRNEAHEQVSNLNTAVSEHRDEIGYLERRIRELQGEKMDLLKDKSDMRRKMDRIIKDRNARFAELGLALKEETPSENLGS